ncbi:MAG: hypothetical protein AAGD25_01425 [Cyanobacteria bacterium P01_F01_bin.150]
MLDKRQRFKGAIACLLALVLGMTACSSAAPSIEASSRIIKRISEVSPPTVVQMLRTINDAKPKVAIASPQADAIIDSDEVSVKFQTSDLELYRDDSLGLGPHLIILLDNQFYGMVYDTTEPLKLKGLTPGTHMIRAIASSAWNESFKNPEAYAQAIFHVFTKTPLTVPPDDLPLLAYGQPTGTYGAEPILLDYFFNSKTSIQESLGQAIEEAQDNITQNWQVRATVNGEPFIFKRWEPIYLQGFKPGKNWVQLELLDDNQQPIEGLFNNTARIIQYEPGGNDTLSLLMRDALTLEEAGALIDPNYMPPSIDSNESEDIEEPEDNGVSRRDTSNTNEPPKDSKNASIDDGSLETVTGEVGIEPSLDEIEAREEANRVDESSHRNDNIDTLDPVDEMIEEMDSKAAVNEMIEEIGDTDSLALEHSEVADSLVSEDTEQTDLVEVVEEFSSNDSITDDGLDEADGVGLLPDERTAE